MKRLFLTTMMALFAFTSLTATVEAKRLGGGGSYGRQAGRMAKPPSAPMRQAPAAPMRQQAQPAPAYPAPAPAPQQGRSGMGGMLGGALLGLGVGSMLGHGANNNGNPAAVNPGAVDSAPAQGGGGSSLLTILVIAGIAYFLYRRFRR
jgi:hypothetical protein